MGFNNISSSTNCDCLKGTMQNLSDTFIRRVRKAADLKAPDFRTHIERNKTPTDITNCIEVCGMNGLSFEIWTEESSKVIVNKHSYSAQIAPKTNNYCVIRFKSESGLLKHTPQQSDAYNEYHYDFYKDDDFQVEKLQLIKMIEF